MRHVLLTAAFLAASLAGCTGNTGTTGSPSADKARTPGTGQQITVTGCVQGGSPAGTYVLNATTAADIASGQREGADGGQNTGTGTSGTWGADRPGPGSRGTGGSSAGGRDATMTTASGTFRLIPGGQENDLGRYLDKRVRVTGEIANGHADRMQQDRSPEDARRGSSGEGDVGRGVATPANKGSGGGRVQPEAAGQSTAGQFLRVRSVQKLSDSCRWGS